MNPPPTPSRPEKNPVAPPTTRLSTILSKVMDVLTPGCAGSKSTLALRVLRGGNRLMLSQTRHKIHAVTIVPTTAIP